MRYQWVLPEAIIDKNDLRIFDNYHIHPVFAEILYRRRINTPEKIERFFNPDLAYLHDPFLMTDMKKAVHRIVKALREGEHILIYGDYDVDGVTSVSILYDGLFRLGGKVSFFIPSRFEEGYGLSKAGIRVAKKRNAKLIITVDCGITAVEQVGFAKEQQIETIVCDHHEPGEHLPEAIALLDPKVAGSPYPFKELAGCGMAYKVLQALGQTLGLGKEFARQYLDLVAIGTSADIVQLTDENRILVKNGLELIKKKKRPGIFALLEMSGMLEKNITVSSIVFVLAPRLNAVGRISNAKKAVHLLTTKSLQQARNIARILEKENKTRKGIDEKTFEEAKRIIEQKIDLESKRILVLSEKGWHPGVIGIVASRLMEKYNRPTVLISIKEGIGKGSARSTTNFNMYRAFHRFRHLFISYGGHQFAAGLTIRENNIGLLDEGLNRYAEEYLKTEEMVPHLLIDAVVNFDQFNAGFFNNLKALAPFGPGNMRPVFVSYHLSHHGRPVVVGKNHLKVKFKKNELVLDAIGYNLGEYIDLFNKSPQGISCAYVLEETRWSGQTTIQMRIKDLAPDNTDLPNTQ